MKPIEFKIELSDYAIKDIKNNIHLYLSKILNNCNKVFEFEFDSLKEDSNKNKLINIYTNNENICIKSENEFKSLLNPIPFKIPKFIFTNQDFEIENNYNKKSNNEYIEKKEENEKEENTEEEKVIYEQSLINSSNNSFSNYSSYSSERYSINENLFNIKEETDKSQSDIIKKM